LDHYNHGDGVKDPWLDEDMQPLALSESEINDLVDFLAALTSSQYQQLGAKVTDVEPPCNRGNTKARPNRCSGKRTLKHILKDPQSLLAQPGIDAFLRGIVRRPSCIYKDGN